MHVKKNDMVIVLAGKDKGKSGKILRAFPKLDRVLVEGVNMKKVHLKGKKKDEKGKVVEKGFSIHVSNVALKDSKKKEAKKEVKPKTK